MSVRARPCPCLPLGRSWCHQLGRLAVAGAKGRQELVEQRQRRVRTERGAGAEGVFPAGLERLLEVVAHPGGGVGVEAAHARDPVAEALFGEDLGDAILGHPGLVAVPEPVRGQAGLDGEPAGERCAVWDALDAPAPLMTFYLWLCRPTGLIVILVLSGGTVIRQGGAGHGGRSGVRLDCAVARGRRGAVSAAERRVWASACGYLCQVPGVSLPRPASSPPSESWAVRDNGARSTRLRR